MNRLEPNRREIGSFTSLLVLLKYIIINALTCISFRRWSNELPTGMEIQFPQHSIIIHYHHHQTASQFGSSFSLIGLRIIFQKWHLLSSQCHQSLILFGAQVKELTNKIDFSSLRRRTNGKLISIKDNNFLRFVLPTIIIQQ